MQSLTDRISTSVDSTTPMTEPTVEVDVHPDEAKLSNLIEQGDLQAAFFLARRLLASGEEWAASWLKQIQSQMV
jgi:hypothetical protein